jgi:hypothetical protein
MEASYINGKISQTSNVTNLVLAQSYGEFSYFLHYYSKHPQEFKYISTEKDIIGPANIVLTGRYKERLEWKFIENLIDFKFFYSVMLMPTRVDRLY